MTYVLVVITVFTTSQGIASQTRFHEFASRPACESAQSGIADGVRTVKGQFGREVYAGCYPKGDASRG